MDGSNEMDLFLWTFWALFCSFLNLQNEILRVNSTKCQSFGGLECLLKERSGCISIFTVCFFSGFFAFLLRVVFFGAPSAFFLPAPAVLRHLAPHFQPAGRVPYQRNLGQGHWFCPIFSLPSCVSFAQVEMMNHSLFFFNKTSSL